MMEKDYRTALIAGAPSQLARELALWLGGMGMQVHVAARAPEELEPYLARARDSGARLLPVELDTSRVEEARERVLALDEACGGLDLVVAAGTYEETSARDLRPEVPDRAAGKPALSGPGNTPPVASRGQSGPRTARPASAARTCGGGRCITSTEILSVSLPRLDDSS